MSERPLARPDGCLSDLRIDQLLAGECAPSVEETARAHLAGCAACSARYEELAAGRDRFAKGAPPLVLPEVAARPVRPARRRARGIWAGAGAAIALAAGIFLFVRGNPADTAGGTRAKGSSHVGFYVKRGDAVTLGAIGERVRPGDSLRFVYSAAEPRYLAILSLDGARRASVYFPDGPRAERVEPAVDRALPSSTVLDETLGEERIYALFCAEAIAVEPLRAALETSGAAPAPGGCEIDALTLRKESPPAP